jgi:hypothetical protein
LLLVLPGALWYHMNRSSRPVPRVGANVNISSYDDWLLVETAGLDEDLG